MKIVLEFDPTEDREALALVNDFLNKRDSGKKPPKAEPKETVPPVKETKEEPEEAPQDEPKAKEKAPAAEISQTEMRRAFMAKNSEENRPKLKKILSDFGAANITELKEEHYPEIMELLEAV